MPKGAHKRDYIAKDRLGGPGVASSTSVTVSNNPRSGGTSDSAKPADPVRRIADGKGRNKRGN